MTHLPAALSRLAAHLVPPIACVRAGRTLPLKQVKVGADGSGVV